MLLLLCGDKKTRSQRSLRRYCCQRCAITRCSSVYEAALLDWLIGFYLQKLFGLSPHTVYDEPVAWNDFGCPGWPPFSQEWHGFGLGAGHKKSHVQPASCLQASVHASAGRPCMRSVFSGGCFMIFHTSMRNIHASNQNDIMMLLGLKMIYSILVYYNIHIIYCINISSTIASTTWASPLSVSLGIVLRLSPYANRWSSQTRWATQTMLQSRPDGHVVAERDKQSWWYIGGLRYMIWYI